MSSVTIADPASAVSARIVGEILLGKIRVNGERNEPAGLYRLRTLLKQIEKRVGREQLKALATELQPGLHALADLIADAVTEQPNQPTTVEKLKALKIPTRMTVEQIAGFLTGRLDKERHWEDTLWGLRKQLRHIADLSVSDITLEEIRRGYDPFVHALADFLAENWQTLVD